MPDGHVSAKSRRSHHGGFKINCRPSVRTFSVYSSSYVIIIGQEYITSPEVVALKTERLGAGRGLVRGLRMQFSITRQASRPLQTQNWRANPA